ncbi:MAG: hypothetical protein ABL974_09605 [Prosthecobacter sp.]
MKISILTAFLALTCGSALAAGPAAKDESAARLASGFELRVPAPGPDAIADTILQEAIDAVASAGGGVVLLGARA